MAKASKHRTIKDPLYGYRRLDPLPEGEDIARFYKRQYYGLIRKCGGRACELQCLIAGGKVAEAERAWLHQTLYSDIAYKLNQYAPGKRVLDVGCGIGEFPLYLTVNGFDTEQIEPSFEAVAIAKSRGLNIYCCTLEEFAENTMQYFDAITLLNILEHVSCPAEIVKIAKSILKPGGIICVRVPNDFSEIQLAAQKQLKKEEWWVCPPDHLNYFNFESLHTLLENLGFEVIYSQGDFPMELFLLMGDDYVGNAEVGDICHQKRIRFELTISGELRRRMYQSMAKVGVGRCCLVFGRLK